MNFICLNTNVFNVLNVLQDVKQLTQRLTSCRWCHCLAAITRHKTSNISKSLVSIYKNIIILYIRCLIFNVFNVLFIKSLVLIRILASRFPIFLTSCNVLNVL